MKSLWREDDISTSWITEVITELSACRSNKNSENFQTGTSVSNAPNSGNFGRKVKCLNILVYISQGCLLGFSRKVENCCSIRHWKFWKFKPEFWVEMEVLFLNRPLLHVFIFIAHHCNFVRSKGFVRVFYLKKLQLKVFM